jgi:NAD(P)H-flavin reductase
VSAAAWGVPEPAVVVAKRRETKDVVTLELSRPAGVGAHRPGQFHMLYAFGVGEVPISVSGDPARGDRPALTIRAVGAVSAALAKLRRGDVVGLRGPFGRPWPIEVARGEDVVFVAGGLGLAPLRPAVHALVAARDAYGRASLLVGARTPEDLLYPRDLERWRRARLDVRTTVDAALHGWTGAVGVVTKLGDELPIDPARTVAFVCGPEIMMIYAVHALARRGLADARIFLSLERNMKCAVALCGHCQLGPGFVCKDGPVFRLDEIRGRLFTREL